MLNAEAPASVRARTHLRLVHPCRPLLSKEQLAHFAIPRTWAEILTLDPSMGRNRWRDGVIDADSVGWALLTFVPGEKVWQGKRATPEAERRKGTWRLSAKGYAFVFGRKP